MSRLFLSAYPQCMLRLFWGCSVMHFYIRRCVRLRRGRKCLKAWPQPVTTLIADKRLASARKTQKTPKVAQAVDPRNARERAKEHSCTQPILSAGALGGGEVLSYYEVQKKSPVSPSVSLNGRTRESGDLSCTSTRGKQTETPFWALRPLRGSWALRL